MGKHLAVPETINRQVAIAKHPDYPEQYRRLRFGRENYEGSGGYAPYVHDVTIADTQPDDEKAGTYQINKSARTHLFKHPREKEKFSRRVIMAYLDNVIKPALSMLLGYITKKQPTYDDYPDQVKKWMSEVNAAGDTWEQYKEHEILPALGYYGWLPTIFFRKPTDSETVAQQEDAGGGLTVEVICPENIVDWLLAADGSFVWLKVKTVVDRTGPLDEKHTFKDRYTWYTHAGYWAVEDDGTSTELPVVDQGAYGNGLPIVVWRLRGGALTADANAVQREHYNVGSLVQEQERGTAFAMLRAPSAGPKDRIVTVGTDNVFWYPHDAKHVPEWMAPPPHVLAHLMAKLDHLAESVIRNMGLDFDKGGGQTGMAFQFKMSKIVRLLQGIANSLSRGETRCLARVAKELGAKIEPKVRCVYSEEFDAKDVEKLMDGFDRILDRSSSYTAKVEADYKMCNAGLGDMDEALRKTIRKEIEDGRKQEDIDADNADELRLQAEEARRRGELPDPDDEDADDIQADGGAR